MLLLAYNIPIKYNTIHHMLLPEAAVGARCHQHGLRGAGSDLLRVSAWVGRTIAQAECGCVLSCRGMHALHMPSDCGVDCTVFLRASTSGSAVTVSLGAWACREPWAVDHVRASTEDDGHRNLGHVQASSALLVLCHSTLDTFKPHQLRAGHSRSSCVVPRV